MQKMESTRKENEELKERLSQFNGELTTMRAKNKAKSMFYPEEKLMEYKEQTRAMNYLVKEHVEGLSKIIIEELNSPISLDSSKEVDNEMVRKETLRDENIENNFWLEKRQEEEKLDMMNNGQELKAEDDSTTRINQIIQLPRCSIVKKTSRNALIGQFKEEDSSISDWSYGVGKL